MGLGDFTADQPPTFGRDRAFIDDIDEVFPGGWHEGRVRPYQFLSVVEQYLEMHGPDAATRYRRARLDVARAYDVTERAIGKACESLYAASTESSRTRFVADLKTLEERRKDE